VDTTWSMVKVKETGDDGRRGEDDGEGEMDMRDETR